MAFQPEAMNGQLIRALLSFTVLAGALVSVGIADAGSGVSPRKCARRTPALRPQCVEASRTRSIDTSALHRYDDDIGDALTAPDIGGGNIVTNDNVSLTFGIHVQNRSAFEPFDAYFVPIDADSNPSTGDPSTGADLRIDVSGRTSTLTAWNGSDFEIVVPHPAVPTGWLGGYGPVVRIDRGAIGDPPRFNVMFEARYGPNRDIAPSLGSWPYEVKPLELTAGRVRVGRARAGGRLVASMRVIRSDFDVPLNVGHVQCDAALAGERLSGRRLATQDLITCAWPVPASGRGKRVRGRVAVTFQGVTATGSFNLRVELETKRLATTSAIGPRS